MSALLVYIIKNLLVSGLFYLYYFFALRDGKFHMYNRIYLLLAFVISLLLPVFHFNLYEIENSGIDPLIYLHFLPIEHRAAQSHSQISSAVMLQGISLLISVALFAIFLSKIIWIYKVKKQARASMMRGVIFLETTVKQAPFSFMSNLFWPEGARADTDAGSKIFRHELTHIKQKHSYDKLFGQLLICIFWMNPFYWLMRNELAQVHESLADANSIEEGDTASFAIMLLQSHNQGRYLDPSNSFFQSSIKRRLNMINLSRTTASAYIGKRFGLPAVMLMLAIGSVIIIQAQSYPKPPPPPPGKMQPGMVIKEDTLNRATDSLKKPGVIRPDGKSGARHGAPVIMRDTLNSTFKNDGKAVEQSARDWSRTIIQNPPNIMFIVDGVETSKEAIRKLDASKITGVNMLKGKDAVAKYGDKARKGVILFTTR